MCCQLSCLGVFWAIISLIAALLNASGYYLPYWIKGSLFENEAYLGSFRRCNYPRMRDNAVEIVLECGRYTSFGDIPSLYWQITTILVGVGSAISLLVAFTAFSGCCLSDVITKGSARTLGCIQLFAAILMVAGGAVYPYGFGSPEVRDVCGQKSGVYRLGSCQLSWSSYIMMAGTGSLFLAFLLSFCASRTKAQRPAYRV